MLSACFRKVAADATAYNSTKQYFSRKKINEASGIIRFLSYLTSMEITKSSLYSLWFSEVCNKFVGPISTP